ncbi:MAG: hypothetical protein K0S74_824 [Chlamydiales bacterium]|jgi:2-polyprenyl-6-methoxyphenol hydroxylase-like FAD-dependent oxidoreductase|nr:hypothetical protein [Chlamydiales bacterium]
MLDTNIVMVGAGPVGLWTALQVKLANPKINIKIFEKHVQFERSHLLRIENNSLEEILYQKSDPKQTTIVQRIFDNIHAKGLQQEQQKHILIRTNELESVLREEVLALGIEIEYNTVVLTTDEFKEYTNGNEKLVSRLSGKSIKTFKDLKSVFAKSFSHNIIIGSDVSHSAV